LKKKIIDEKLRRVFVLKEYCLLNGVDEVVPLLTVWM
jgi:hypothetical protein